MKIQRTLPPTVAPIYFRDILHGLAGLIVTGRYTKEIEAEVKEYFGVKHVFLVSSGKAALALILVALKSLMPRQEVLIPAYTCFSVPSAIIKADLKVSLCDIDSNTLDFDYAMLKQTLTHRTLAVVPTHLLGLPSDVDRVKDICREKGAYVVEDAAQAMGGRSRGKMLGTIGDVGFFSLGRGKNITCGSGGIILTNSDTIAKAVRNEYAKLGNETFFKTMMNLIGVMGMGLLINPRFYWLPAALPFLKLGETKFFRDFSMCRLNSSGAGLLLHWKERLEQSNSARCAMSGEFIHQLASPFKVIQSWPWEQTPYLRLPVMAESKKAKAAFCSLSKKHGIGVSSLYPSGIHAISELQERLEKADFPTASVVAERLLTLPVHHLVKESDRKKICQMLNAFNIGMPVGSWPEQSRDLGRTRA